MSAGSPLTVSYPPLLDSIIESSQRWQQLELSFLHPESDIFTRFLSISPDDLCMLRELRIHSLYSMLSLHTQEDLWYRSGLLTAQGLRSISIALPQMNAFHAGIPPNWKNLNHLFFHSPILLGLAHSMLSYCCNLVACLLEIDGLGTNLDASITLSSCILPCLTFLSLQGNFISCSQLFGSIKAPSLQVLDYHGYFPSVSEEFGLLNFFQNNNSLKTLRLDHHHFTESNVLKYYTLIPSVTHLVLGPSPKWSRSPSWSYIYSDPPHDAYPRYIDFNTLHEFRHQYSIDSAPTLLFPSLETFEAYGFSGVTDAMLLEFIKARIDATKSNTGVSKLKKVLVEFSRAEQTDIVPEALAYAQEAGINLELNLKYHTTEEIDMTQAWSLPFGLTQDDDSWVYPWIKLDDY